MEVKLHVDPPTLTPQVKNKQNVKSDKDFKRSNCVGIRRQKIQTSMKSKRTCSTIASKKSYFIRSGFQQDSQGARNA